MRKTLLATLIMGMTSSALAANLTVISNGGTSKDAQTVAYYKPFEKVTHNKVIAGEFNGEMGMIKAMVDTGSVSWDVVQVEGPELLRGCDEGLFEHLDQTRLGNAADFLDGTFSDCGAGLLVWSMAMAYDTNRLPSAPTGWADFWNTQKFPGKRALRKGAKYNVEIALLADGVPKEDLYKVLSTPEGVDRAFRKLDQIRSSIQRWESGAQPLQFLASGDVVMSTAYNGRVFAAQGEGVPMKVVWSGSLYAIDYWAIPKGSPNKQTAEDFISFSLRPEQQQIYTSKMGYGSTNLKTAPLLDPSVLERLNTAPGNLEQAVPVDFEFWVDHGEDLEQRFNAWAAKAN
ncbi:polyamine ABC transporter substrate-binding protein [Pseudomonas aeruginosa]